MAFILKKEKQTIKNNNLSDEEMRQINTPEGLLKYARYHNIKTTPLDVEALTETLGITLRFVPLSPDISGKLFRNDHNSKWVMEINSLHHPHRQRFSIAHELAHFCCDICFKKEFKDSNFFRDSNRNQMEIKANQFAAKILMPEQEFNEQVTLTPLVKDIADFFEVSAAAVLFRARELGYKV